MQKEFSKSGKRLNGFTLIELVVVITIIGILSTIGVFSYIKVQANARDSEKSAKITAVAEALEKYYSQNGEYPTCTDITKDPNTVVNSTLVGLDQSSLKTPEGTSGTNSYICTDPSVNDFGYIGGGSQYTLKYLSEGTNSLVTVASRHAPTLIGSPQAPSVTVAMEGSNLRTTIAPLTCVSGTAQYGVKSRTNDGTWSSYSDWSTTSVYYNLGLPGLLPPNGEGVKYSYQAQARCYINSTTMSNVVTGAEAAYTSPITAPAAPVVTTSTVADTTTWSWPSVTCGVGTASYQYRYTISPSGYDSGWVANGANISIAFTTATTGQTYIVAVQANCSNLYTTSAWSASGSATYVAHSGQLVALTPQTIATGNSPYDIAISADGTSVYIVNSQSSTISMYSRNTSTGALTALATPTISTGLFSKGITISYDGTSVYTASSNDNTISMYSRNASTGALTALATPTISTGSNSKDITISPDGTSVYVACLYNIYPYSRNTSTGALTALTKVSANNSAAITISADGKSVYTANAYNTVSMYSRNTSTGALTALATPTITTGSSANDIAISPDGTSVYVTASDYISMYSRDTNTGALTALTTPTITTPSPTAITISPDGTSAYVANGSSSNNYTVSMYNRNTNTGALTALTTPTITTGGADPVAIATSFDGSSVYVVNTSYGTVSMFTRN